MNENFDPVSIECAVARIAQYAREHKLSPSAVCDIFSAGLCAARILAPGLAEEEIERHNVKLRGAEQASLAERPSRTQGSAAGNNGEQ